MLAADDDFAHLDALVGPGDGYVRPKAIAASAKGLPLPKRVARLLRDGGGPPTGAPSELKRCGNRMAFQYDRGLTLYLTQEHVTHGRGYRFTFDALMDGRNAGGFWLQRQPDPEAAFVGIWAAVRRDLLPSLRMEERYSREQAIVRARPAISQKEIVAAVGHRNEGAVRKDLAKQVASGVMVDEVVMHGAVPYHHYSMSEDVTAEDAELLSLEDRRQVAEVIRRREARARYRRRWVLWHRQGCIGTDGVRADGVPDPATVHRILGPEPERTSDDVEERTRSMIIFSKNAEPRLPARADDDPEAVPDVRRGHHERQPLPGLPARARRRGPTPGLRPREADVRAGVAAPERQGPPDAALVHGLRHAGHA